MMFSVRESIIVFTESQIKYDIPKYLADTYIVSQVLKPPSFFLPSSPWSKKKKKKSMHFVHFAQYCMVTFSKKFHHILFTHPYHSNLSLIFAK